MKPVTREFTVELHQVGATVKVIMEGSGPLQERIEFLEKGAFRTLMSGLKSDMLAFVHGDFRRKLIAIGQQFKPEIGNPVEVKVASAIADDVVKFQLYANVKFTWQLTNEMKQDFTTTLTACFHGNASASVNNALESLGANVVMPSNPQGNGMMQMAMTPEMLQQLEAVQGGGGMQIPASMIARGITVVDDQPAPGQYL